MTYKKGFTLIELIVVMVIIGILAAIAIPNYNNFVQQGAATAAQHNLITIYNAQRNYYFANNAYCTTTTGGTASTCGDTLPHLNTNLATLNQAVPTSTNLNITDNYFNYQCIAPITGGFQCKATNIASPGFTLTVLGGPPNNNQIVLLGAVGCATTADALCNPKCAGAPNPSYCPSS